MIKTRYCNVQTRDWAELRCVMLLTGVRAGVLMTGVRAGVSVTGVRAKTKVLVVVLIL